MDVEALRDAMMNEGNDIYFDCDGKKSGVASTVKNSVFLFQSWYGTKVEIFDTFEQMVSAKFFDGKSILDMLDTIDFYFC